jgi:NAD dependent epimerase/dehydratase family enzyme
MLGRLLPLFRLGLGGRVGSGRQVMSWIGLSEWVAAARFLLARDGVFGPVNMTTPNPVSNAEFTAALAAAVHRPAVMFVPVPALKLAVGGVSSDILSSARVMPRRLLAEGYRFAHPDIAGALAAELG